MYRIRIPLAHFYRYCLDAARREGFYVVLCVIAREADLPNLFKEVSENWSSLHDLTGKEILFLFAGDPINTEASNGLKLEKKSILFYSEMMKVNSPSHLNLPTPSSERDLQSIGASTPRLREGEHFSLEHTLQIAELRKELSLRESEIPTLHFSFLNTNQTYSISIKGMSGFSIYHFIKRLMGEWENVFHQISSLYYKSKKLEAFAYEAQLQKRHRHSSVFEKARQNVVSATLAEKDTEMSLVLKQMVEILDTPISLSDRTKFYNLLGKVKDKKLVSALQKAMDLFFRKSYFKQVTGNKNQFNEELKRQNLQQNRLLLSVLKERQHLLLQDALIYEHIKVKRHSNVLVIFSNPKNSLSLRLGYEDRVINECIKLSKYRDNFSLDIRHAAQIDDVARSLLNEEYRIVHFSGHGTKDGLVFENESGKSQIVTVNAMADLLSSYSPPVECVLLNACNTYVHKALNVPYTIAMSDHISDLGAIEFARGFYDAIGAGKNIEFAYEEGCRRIKLKNLPDSRVPKIFKLNT